MPIHLPTREQMLAKIAADIAADRELAPAARKAREDALRERIAAAIEAARMPYAGGNAPRLVVGTPASLEPGDDDDELVESAPVPAPRRTRTPLLTKVLREAKKAGISVAGATTAERTAMAAAFEAERAELEARIEDAMALARAPEPACERRRQRRPPLASTFKKAAKRGGADRVEIDPRSGRIVIPLTGAAAGEPSANGGSNELENWIAKHADKIKGPK